VTSRPRVSLVDQPSRDEIEAAARLWFEAEALRVPTPPLESYLEDQRRGFVDTLSRRDAWLTVAVAGRTVVGLVGGLCPTASQPAAYLGYLAVDPAHRRQGIGLLLLKRARTRAAQMGSSTMLLTVHETNTGARQLYEQCGWLPTGRTETTPLGDEPLIEYAIGAHSE
jgi:ribosomal protein S18 acetylase RimI-like enzyme